jgi:uncharacterized protein
MKNLFKNAIVFLIKLYKYFVSPLFPASCRHYPTCSEYAIESIKKYGVLKGGYMSVIRILKCNPLFRGGYDPVR